jgi:hypothetical protein
MSLPAILTIGEAARYSGLHRNVISGAMHRASFPAARSRAASSSTRMSLSRGLRLKA